MPPVIKSNRALLKENFTDALMGMYKVRLKTLAHERRVLPESSREHFDQNNRLAVSRMLDVTRSKEAFDRELTEMRALPYEVFDTFRGYIVAKTKPVTIENMTTHQKYDAGEYAVFISIDVASMGITSGLGNDKRVHMVPLRDPWFKGRHPHHRANGRDGEKHPVEVSASTCWGSFGTIAASCIRSGDFVDFFRIIATYLTRYDQNSPLWSSTINGSYFRGVDAIPFIKEIV
jgi:hypothetical protein